MMERLIHVVLHKPKLVIGILALVTLLQASFIPGLTFDASIERMIPDEDPVISDLRETSDEFGSQEFFLIAIGHDTIFRADTLEKIDEMAQEIAALRGVDDVISPLTVDLIESSLMGIEIRPIVTTTPTTEEEIAEFRRDILGSPYGGKLVTDNGRWAAIMVELERFDEERTQRRQQLISTIEEVVRSYEGPERLVIVGDPYVNYYTEQAMQTDLRTLIPIVIVVIAAVLFASFGTLRGVVIPLITVFASLVWTLGLMALLGIPVSMVSMVMPIILVTIGSAAGIHILNKYQESLGTGLSKEEALRETYRVIAAPVAMAALTTSAGFAALITSFVEPIRVFGLLTAFGVLAAMVFSLTLIPAILSLLRVPQLSHQRPTKVALTQMLHGLGHTASARPQAVLMMAALLLLVAAVGTLRLGLEGNILNYFAANSPIIQGTNVVEEEFGGSMQLSIVFDTERYDGIKEPAVLEQIVELKGFLESLEHVHHPTSIADLVRELNQAFWDGEPEFYRIPESREAVAQQLLLFTMQGGAGLDSFVSYNFERAIVTAQMKSLDAGQMASIITRVEDYVASRFADEQDLSVKVVGMPIVMLQLMDRYVQTQIHSLLTSTVAVGIIVSLLMKSLAIGLLCLLPLAFTVLINFGIMGYANIPLDAVTTVIASIAIGIGVDYSIHYVSRYRREMADTSDSHRAITETSGSAGRGIFFNALALIVGFLILVFSHFRAISVFGYLIATTMFISSLAALSVIPAVLRLLPERTPRSRGSGAKESIT